MGIATAGGFTCPACKHDTLTVIRSMYDYEPLYAFCCWMESEPCLSWSRLNRCGWHWDKDDHGPREFVRGRLVDRDTGGEGQNPSGRGEI